MDTNKVTAKSPVRILEKMIAGELGAGTLGVIMARAGEGKTAFLIQIGLDAALRQKNVLHVARGQNTDHVQAWYDALFEDLIDHNLPEAAELRASLTRHRVIQTYSDIQLSPERLDQTITLFKQHMNFNPDMILLDGFDWESMPLASTAAALGAFKAFAQRLNASLWMSAQTHRTITNSRPQKITPPCDAYDELIDIAVFLEPEGRDVGVRVLKGNDARGTREAPLLINCDTFSLTSGRAVTPAQLPPGAYTLLSGGAQGAEAAFGEVAEQWGLNEINFSFEGHQTTRTRGLVSLSGAELEHGHVSDVYLKTQMHRNYPDTPLFRKVLQSIWHQVNTAGEVFVVGAIMPDGTVKGGTGWAAELGRHWHKPVHVFDQDKNSWFSWQENQWTEEAPPVIARTRFTGSGTRFLEDRGREAIRSLFERSFGKPS